MKIQRIHVDGFGRFADRAVGPFDSPVTVFYGPNEAGKTTLLAFIRAILFGFPTRLGREHYPPMAGGRHGGRITLADAAERLYVVERFQGRGNGPVTVTTESGETRDGATLGQLLGGHSQDVFQSIFAFTLDELHSERLLNDRNVNAQIYSAGMGAAELPKAAGEIEKSREDIFLNRGSSQKIYYTANRLDEIDSTLQEVANNAAEYGRLQSREREIEESLRVLNARRREIESRRGRQDTLRNAWDAWNDLDSAERRLADLPIIENFPEDGVSRLEILEERVRTARKERDDAARQVERAKGEADAPVANRALLERGESVQRIQRGRDGFDQSVHDLPEREVEVDGARKALSATLADLGPEWDVARLESFDISVAVREEIAGFQDLMLRAIRATDQADIDRRQTDNDLAEANESLARARQSVEEAERPQLDDNEIVQRRALIRTARSKLGDLSRVRERIADAKFRQVEGGETDARPAGAWTVAAVAALSIIAGVALVAAGAVLGDSALLVGAVAGLALAAVGAYLYVSRPASASGGDTADAAERASLRRAESEAERISADIEEDAAPLGLDAIDDAALIAAEGDLDRQVAMLSEWNRLTDLLDDAGNLATQRRERAERSERAAASVRRELQSARAEWRDWLLRRSLRETFTPETVVEIRGKVDLGKNQLETLRDRQRRVEAIRTDIREYTELVAPLAVEFGTPLDADDQASVAAAADRLIELHSESAEAARRHEDASAALAEAESGLAERENQLAGAFDEVDTLLTAGDASDAENFRRRHEQLRQRNETEDRRREALRRLQQLSGPGGRLEALKADLANTDAQSIDAEIQRLEDESGCADIQIGERSTERGSIQTQLKDLIGEEQSSALRMERGVLLEQIRGHAREWTKLTIARNLLAEARGKFERERQPGVVRHAQGFFSEITGARYGQVYAPMGRQTITVTDSDGRPKQPSQLSRGAREQLFLSLRFGLIRELGERTEPLPVVVDEILVNFDPERALRAASAFVELSQTNQILVFTCHPTTVELFRQAAEQSADQPPEVISLG